MSFQLSVDYKKIWVNKRYLTRAFVKDEKAYKGKTNRDLEKDILVEMPAIPYVAQIENVTALDVED